ncbi:MAG: hypothetical protein ASARMPRED_004741 [Alectoria sarmentosa]|nr:MAG: hypothetical protein ASARMPRED_004741 [Alectoria sarmentosa]
MPADDYTAAISGGLKLKGVNSSGKVSKHHKKQRPKHSQPETSANASADKSKDGAIDDGEQVEDGQEDATIGKGKQLFEDGEATSPPPAGKTEAELRHEEHRRKRARYFLIALDERLKREGTKTHKERVEELNRYLSNLSRESALDKTSVKQRHMYITEAHSSPNTSKGIPGG